MQKLGAAKISMFVNIGLLASKIVVAFITGSIGLYAESAHSFFDLVASVLAYLGIRKAEQPEDHSHHFGHEKFENLSSLLQALLITGTAFVVLFEAYQKISGPGEVEFSEAGIILMLISIPVTYFTSRYLGDIAKKEGSSALEADSAHFTTDVISSVAVLLGLILVKLGYVFGDPLGAIVVGLVMLYISIELLLKSFWVFMDFSPEKDKMAKIVHVLDSEKGITRYHKLRARIAGSRILVDVHIHVPHKTSVVDGHKIAHDIETRIMREVPEVKEVSVHVEPD
ncbi:Ferrous-iron efflux pump FieF [Candidatus Bilamarchaeum dharawalense]|uniref:Ferrous-iron efflux pump FieF n=1 Tax=Candidatus Bilamarchaeum dharawalense TaxID=2885759 RepID=A0A5E4LQN1_9ARCH|nr:Ferrous-iron efflux pump FieF [Candidatus Bilamarchaeum dharawalense]